MFLCGIVFLGAHCAWNWPVCGEPDPPNQVSRTEATHCTRACLAKVGGGALARCRRATPSAAALTTAEPRPGCALAVPARRRVRQSSGDGRGMWQAGLECTCRASRAGQTGQLSGTNEPAEPFVPRAPLANWASWEATSVEPSWPQNYHFEFPASNVREDQQSGTVCQVPRAVQANGMQQLCRPRPPFRPQSQTGRTGGTNSKGRWNEAVN